VAAPAVPATTAFLIKERLLARLWGMPGRS
jgi:hypothetical protein